MKLNSKTQQEFFIPTQRIKPSSRVASGITLFQGDAYLYGLNNYNIDTQPIYFIQRNDNVIDVELAGINDDSAYDIIDDYRRNCAFINPKLQIQVVRCNVPHEERRTYLDNDMGPLHFIAHHHPSHMIRVKALITLADKYFVEGELQLL